MKALAFFAFLALCAIGGHFGLKRYRKNIETNHEKKVE